MSLLDALGTFRQFSPVTVPELRYLEAAAERVRARWPDVQIENTEKEREALAQKLRTRVENSDWEATRLSFMTAAASAVFDNERRYREDLAGTREFLYAEIAASTSETFLAGLFRVYMESFEPRAPHSTRLANLIKYAISRMSETTQRLIEALPELLNPTLGPEQLADRVAGMSDPFTELVKLGLSRPHGAGFMDHAHQALTKNVRIELSERNKVDWYINWLRPPGKEEGRTKGAEVAIEALVHPWLNQTPDDDLRSHLVETLIEMYGDPRIKSGGVWGGIDERHLAIIHRWLTREDMRFFTGVVDATQNSNMWPPRRDFWLKLYDEGKIDAAWAALSSEGFQYAISHLMRQNAKNAHTRVGYQAGRPNTNTSLLVLKIGNKIVVDGCHNYRTHVFDAADPMAPKLFAEGYECDEIMRASPAARPHGSSRNSMEPWKRWVRDMINADVPQSQQTRAYSAVRRPSPRRPGKIPEQQAITSRERSLRALAQAGLTTSSPDSLSTSAKASVQSAPQVTTSFSKSNTHLESATNKRHFVNQEPKPKDPDPGDQGFQKQAQFLKLTDRMIAFGPEAAAAVLAYLEEPSEKRNRPALSPKSREALNRIMSVNGELNLSLTNALEHLLIGLKRSGVDLDDLFASGVPNATDEYRISHLTALSESVTATEPLNFPPLPELADDRMNVLRTYADALEEIGLRQKTFKERAVSALAIQKLKERNPDLRPTEIAVLQELYKKLRENSRGKQR